MMKLISIFKKLSLTLAIILAATTSIFASHGMGADLTYDYVSANTYKVRLKFFRDCHGILPGNTNTINIRSASGGFNSNYILNQVGGALDITPLCSSQQSLCTNSSSPNDGVQQYTYEATITLATPRPDYIISFSLCCRNGAITTLNNPGGQNIYVEAVLNSQVANSSPDFNNAPVPFVCNGQLVNYNHGVTDIDGDELVFSLAPCLQGAGTSVTYNAGFSGTNPLSTVSPFAINTSTGALSFTPNAVQVGVIGVKVEEYRLVGGIRTKIGEVLRDMQITVDNCDPASGGGGVTINSAPIVSGINGTAGAGGTTGSYVINATAGTPISFNLAAYDDYTTNLNLSWNGGISGATFTPNGTGTAASFSWTPTINDGGNKFFTINIKDDNCPLLGISVYTFTIQVAVPVSITCPSNQSTTTATGTCAKTVSYISTATGTPAPIVTYNFSGATTGSGNGDGSGSSFNKGVTTVTLTATDGGGNTATCQFTVTVTDAQAPSITCPANISVGNSPGTCGGAVVTYTAPIGTDNCPSATTTQIAGLASGATFPMGVTTNTFRVIDAVGNSTTCSFTVTVTDTEAPSISCPANISVNNAAGTCGAVVNYTAPIGTDNCASVTTTQVAGLASGATFPVGVTTNTFRATDAAGNSTTCSFTVTVVDVQPPSITCPANISVGNTPGTCGAIVTYTAPIGTDNCPSATTARVAGLPSGATFPIGVTTIAYRVTDAAGNFSTCSFTVTVNDTQVPVLFNCPANISVNNAPGICGAVVFYTPPTGSDNCPLADPPTITAGLPSGATFPVGVTTVTYRVTDAAGNSSSCSFTVTVADTEAPSITCRGNIVSTNAVGTCGVVLNYTAPIGTDNCPSATTTQIAGLASGATFPVGITTNTFRVTDAAGNSTTCSFTVTVVDVEAPSITCPANISVSNAAGTCGAVATYTAPIGTDNCSSATTTQIAGLASGATFPVGITTNTFRVTDAAGNSTTCSFTVTVTDTEAPSISCPANISVGNDAGVCGAVVSFTAPIGTDNCPLATTTQIAGLASGATFPIGTTTNTFRVTDAAGNSTTCSFTVTVTDTEAPSITCQGNISVSNGSGICGAVVTYTAPIGTDNCPSATTTQIAGLPSGATFPVGVTTNTFLVTDAAGNTATCSFTVIVNDTQAPVITCPTTVVVTANNDGSCTATGVTLGTATATDNCGGVIGITNDAPSAFPQGNTNVTWTATDAAGNTSTCVQIVTVNPYIANVVQPTSQTVCTAASTTAVTFTSTPAVAGVIYTWTNNNTSIGLASSGTGNIPSFTATNTTNAPLIATIVVTASTSCAGSVSTSKTFTITVNPVPVVNAITNQGPLCNNTSTAPVNFATTNTGAGTVTYTWVNNTPSIGLPAIGSGNIPSFTVNNSSISSSLTATITVTPHYTLNSVTCDGPAKQFNITVQPASNGSITGASNTQTCAGEGASVNVILNGTLNFTSTFRIREILSSSPLVFGPATITAPNTSVISGSQAISVAGASLPNTSSVSKTYRIDFNSLQDGNGCTAVPQLGSVDITVNPLPVISVSAAPTSDVCPGTNVSFNVTETNSIVGSNFKWVAKGANNVILGSGNNISFGAGAVNTNLGLSCASTFVNPITFTFTPVGPSTLFCNGVPVTRVVNIRDLVAPTASTPAAINVECYSAIPAANINVVTGVTDNCDAAPVVTLLTNIPAAPTCNGGPITVTRVYRITDCSGNSSTVTQTINVADVTAPTANTPASISVQCYSAIPAANINVVTGVTDNCDAAPVVTLLTNIPAAPTCNGGPITVTRVYRITDCSGNSSTVTQTINVADVTAPTANTPASISVQCYSAIPAANINVVTGVTDNCDAAPVVTLLTNIPAAPTCNGGPITVTRVYRITDCSGNSSTVTQTINVADVTAPTANTPAAINVQCYSAIPAANINVVTGVTDNCDAAPVVTLLTNIPAAPTCNGGPITVTRVYRITDCSGNSSTVTQTINVADVTAPIITSIPANVTVGCANLVPAVNTLAVVASDNCNSTLTITANDVITPGSCANRYSIARTYTVTDCSGNSTSSTQTITVNDITGPVLIAPATQTLNVGAGAGCSVPMPDYISLVSATASDACGAGVITYQQLAPNAPGSLVIGYGGTRTIVIVATDACGNTSTTSFLLNLVDQTAPTAICKSITVNLSSTTGGGTVSITPTMVNNGSTDNCSAVTLVSVVPSTFTCANVGANTVTLTVRDDSGNTSTCTSTVTVKDITAPSITCNAPIITTTGAGNTQCGAVVTFAAPVVTDNCSGATTVQTTGLASGSLFPVGVTTNTFVATDASGNTASCSFTVTVTDNTAPIIVCNAPIVTTTGAGNTQCGRVVTYTAPVGTDNCSGATTVQTAGLASGSLFPLGITTNTFVTTDAAGNTATCSFTVTVTDNTAPIAICKSITVNLSATPGAGSVSITPAMVNNGSFDNCSPVTLVSVVPSTFNCANVGPNTVTLTVSDAAGNTSTCTSIVTVKDITAPVVTCFGDTTIFKGNICTNTLTDLTGRVNATDNCSIVSVTQSVPVGTVIGASIANLPITLTVTDASGNTSSCTFNVHFIDNTPAVISGCPANITVNTSVGNTACGQVATWVAPTASDNCNDLGLPTLVSTQHSGDVFPVGNTTVTYTATDAAGNTSTCSFVVTVVDNTSPIITGCPSTVSVNTGAGNTTCSQTASWTAPTASDNCSIQSFTSTHLPGATFPVGTTVVTYTATDIHGNSSTCSFNVIVTDNTAPLLTCNAPITTTTGAGNTQCGKVVTYTAPVGTDNCSGATTAQTAGLPSGSLFPVGVTTNTFVTTDAAGNTATCSFTVTVTDDTKPLITCTAPIVTTSGAGNTQCGKVVTYTAPIGTDNCSGATTAQTAGLPSGSLFPVGVTTNTFVTTDAAGNTATCSFTVTVTDNTAPLLTCNAPITTTTGAGNTQCGKVVTYTAPVGTDNCSGATTAQTAGLPSGSLFPVGVTTNTFVTTDAAGNTTTCSFTVTVTDNTAPLLTCNAPIITTTGAGNTQCGKVVTYTAPVGTDNCSGATTAQTAGLPSGSLFPVGVTTNTFVTTDAAGNTATCSFTVTVTDNTAPLLTCNAPITTTTGAGNTQCGKVVTYTAPVGTDNCSGATTAQIAGLPSGSLFPVGVTTNTFVTTDAAGNTATCSFTVTVTDNTAPLLTCNAPITTTTGAGNTQCGKVVTYTAPVGTDNCSGATTTQTAGLPSGSLFPVGVTTNTFVTTDAAGNTATCSFTVTVTDNTAPLLTCNAPITTTTGAGNTQCGKVVTYTAPVGTDNCSGATTTQTAGLPSGSLFPVGVTTNTFVTTDGAGNTATCSFTVTVTDNTAPVFVSCPSPITGVNPNGTGCLYTLATVDPVITDNCTATPSYAWTMSGPGAVAPLSGTGSIGTHSFAVGTTTVVITATDAAGNTSTCSYLVNVVNNLSGTISGNANVLQNTSSTSTITFTGAGGVKPYTFTYKVNGGANQTVSTTGSNNIVTVPQSNAVLGSFAYTLVSVTDANGCTGTLTQTTPVATVNVVSTLPDFSPIVNIDATQFAATGSNRDFIVNVSELGNSANIGAVVFRVTQPASLDITFTATSGSSNVFGGTANNNSDWTIVKTGSIITCTLKNTASISAFGNSVIGFKATRKASVAANQTGSISASIVNGSGGDNVNSNNGSSIVTSAQ